MRALERNKKTLYYSIYGSKVPIYETDEEGNTIYLDIDGTNVPVETGSFQIGYSLPKEIKANLSNTKGVTDQEVFGTSLDYTKTIYTTDRLPINENSLIWHETLPVIKEDGTIDKDSADYTVVQIANALNGTIYAIKKIVK